MTVDELTPGMAFKTTNPGTGRPLTLVYVTKSPAHPLYSAMRAVVWRTDDPANHWNLAAVAGDKDVGTPIDQPPADRKANLAWALFEGNHKLPASTKKPVPPPR